MAIKGLTMRVHKIVPKSYVDGPGLRTALFTQGCPIRCIGCQNQHLWDRMGGHEAHVADVVIRLLSEAVQAQAQGHPEGGPWPAITITGGEPFAQPIALAYLTASLRAYGADVILYTGYVWEDLWVMAEGLPEIRQVLMNIDVLVDGPYDRYLDSPGMQYRGSANQRVIDVKATLRPILQQMYRSEAVECPEPVLLDWDTPEIIVTEDGALVGASPIIEMLAGAGVGAAGPARRCGSTR